MSASQEKVGIDMVEKLDSEKGTGNGLPAPIAPEDFGFTPEEEKKIIRHVDRRLVLTVGAMYCISLMDRTNLGAANIAGMGKDLLLTGNRYVSFPRSVVSFFLPSSSGWLMLDGASQNIISLVFFITYVVFQPPSTIVVRKIGPRIHMALITALWGCCMIGMAFVKKWDQMAGLRILLGVLEAGFFPSCVYLLSTWYTRCESPMVWGT